MWRSLAIWHQLHLICGTRASFVIFIKIQISVTFDMDQWYKHPPELNLWALGFTGPIAEKIGLGFGLGLRWTWVKCMDYRSGMELMMQDSEQHIQYPYICHIEMEAQWIKQLFSSLTSMTPTSVPTSYIKMYRHLAYRIEIEIPSV